MELYLAKLREGATIVTATQRLTRAIVAEHDRRQREGGAEVWERPDVLPWDAFVGRAHEDLVHAGALGPAPPYRLGGLSELVVWEGIVGEAAGPEHPLLDVTATARAARAAWRLMHDWELPEPRDRWLLGDDQRAFVGWAGAFARACRELRALDAARVPDVLAEAWKGGAPAPGGPIAWAGFDERTPIRERVDAALRAAGTATEELDTTSPPGNVTRLELPAAEDELRAFAAWARKRLERRPEARLGLVLPEVAPFRERVDAALGETLQPRRALAPRPSAAKLWNVSIGPALIEYPMIAAALDVLRLTQGRPAAALVGSLLRAPFLGGAETEQIPRARLDAHLRERGEPRFSLERLRRGPARSSCPDLTARLAVLLERRIPLRSRAAPSRWAERFASWLEAMGWPGERSLGSDEYQLLERWRVLLDELAGLDAVRPEIDGAEALDRLSGAAAREVFQPRSPETPVQVLGVLEAAGLSFDGLWFAGLHDEAWPPAAHPSPFLPLGLQREHQVPGSSPGRTARWAQKVTDRLLGSAPEIVLSAPGLDGERELRPSPLLVRHPLADAGEVAALPLRRLSHELRRDDAVETVSDGRGPQVASGDPVRGGTSLFADQAACPFRGFAHHRLRARALEDHGRGVDARVRGTLVHGTLERLWTRLQGGAALEETDPQGLAAQVEACAEEAVEDEARRRPESLSPRFVELEVARLVAAVGRLLARERERAPFEVVRRESLETLEIGGVSVHVRPDRVDRLGSGGLAVLDYKTGDPRSLGWFEERLEEPQLPIYATGLRGERIDAVALVHVRPDAATLKGVAREEGVLPGVNAFVQSREVELFGDFDGLLAHWRQWLEALADEVRRGEAAVAPKKPPQTCRYCDLRALCRVDERLGWHPHDAAEPDAEPSGAGADDG